MEQKGKHMTAYNGHRSWNAWNVSLWINNDEGLYFAARDLVKEHGITKAVRLLLEELPATTPDGGRYNKTCVREAIRDILD